MSAPATTGVLRTKVSEMQIGDYIPFSYLPALNTIWSLGKVAMGVEAPFAGRAFSDTGSNDAYFVKVAKGLLISDRVLAHTISWDALNTRKDIQGRPWDSGNIIPTMTSNTSPSGVASASGVTALFEAWKAFDKVLNNASYWQVDGTTGWIGYQFPSSKVIKKYSITSVNSADAPLNRSPKSWKLEASNDGTNWTILDSRENQITWTSNEKRSFELNNKNDFIYYRLNVNSVDGGTYLTIAEFELFDTVGIIRSLIGGVAYTDVNGNMSLTDKGLGAWPTINEWDKYIVNFPLDMIEVGKTLDDVFHWSNCRTWIQETPILNVEGSNAAKAINATWRMIRSHTSERAVNVSVSSFSSTSLGFRPVFEYKEV